MLLGPLQSLHLLAWAVRDSLIGRRAMRLFSANRLRTVLLETFIPSLFMIVAKRAALFFLFSRLHSFLFIILGVVILFLQHLSTRSASRSLFKSFLIFILFEMDFKTPGIVTMAL